MSDRNVRLTKQIRSDLREYADENDMTYSEALDDILPDDVEGEVLDRGESVYVRFEEDVAERLDELAGDGYDHADVVAHFLYEGDET